MICYATKALREEHRYVCGEGKEAGERTNCWLWVYLYPLAYRYSIAAWGSHPRRRACWGENSKVNARGLVGPAIKRRMLWIWGAVGSTHQAWEQLQ